MFFEIKQYIHYSKNKRLFSNYEKNAQVLSYYLNKTSKVFISLEVL